MKQYPHKSPPSTHQNLFHQPFHQNDITLQRQGVKGKAYINVYKGEIIPDYEISLTLN